MLFDRLLKKTRQVLEAKKPPENILELALGHGDPGRRLEAIGRLTSLPHLRGLFTDDADPEVREAAQTRYRALLAGADPTDPTPAERLAEGALVQDQQTLEYLARHGQDAGVRRAAIDRISRPAILVECALHDGLAANRGAAVARLDDRQDLEQVARQIGKKDKAVYRTVRDKLRRLHEREAEPRRISALCADLCERAERLGHLQQWTQDRALLEHLDRQWAEIAVQAETAWSERYAAARAGFIAADAAYRAANAAQLAAQEERVNQRARREALMTEAGASLALDAETQLRETAERLTAEWAALGTPADPEQRDQDRRFRQQLQALAAAGQTLADHHRQQDRLRSTITKATKLLQQSNPLDLRQTEALIEQGRALAKDIAQGTVPGATSSLIHHPSSLIPNDPSAADTAAFAELADRLETRLKTQRRHAEQRLAEVPARIDALEALIEAGELKKADPIHQSLQASLDLIATSGLPRDAIAPLEARLRALSPRLRDLQHWRRWGADQHREALCGAMEALREQDLPLAAVAERLHVLKTDWQEVDRSGSPANKALWERFHQAAAAVAERVRPFQESQAEEQESNRSAREQVCRQLEDFLSRVDWERVDWKRVLRAEREVRAAWSQIGPCEQRERRRLERRFHQALSSMDQRIETERARNQAFKRELIERVGALLEQPDLDAAIEETKAIQRQWQTTVPARQRDENRLWQGFRTSCDAVFERRTALHQAQRGELEANLTAREALCDEAIACADTEPDPHRLSTALRDFEQRWRDGESMPVPRPAVAALNRRWQQARERLREGHRRAEETAERAVLDLLARRVALCEGLEQALLDDTATAPDPAAAERSWSSLPELPDRELQAALEQRLRTALEAATDPARRSGLVAQSRLNAERRARLCLELEVAAGLDSPPALAQERLRLQVSRLAERMSEGEGDAHQGLAELVRAWYLLGPAPRDPELEERVERVRQALAIRTTVPQAPESEPEPPG
jgi:hypothetical protein